MKPFCIDWDEFKDTKLCNAWVATAIIGSAVVGAGASIYGASQAKDSQQKGFNQAATIAEHQYETTRGDLAPYRDIGGVASKDLTNRLTELTTPISVNPDDFQNSDMYKFQAYQGARAAQNSAAARGLGVSGAALKGATTFANNLAATNWQQNFNNQNTNQTNAYNRLKSLVDTGENASAQTGTAGTAAANTAASATGASGNAGAAASNATGNAISSGANNALGGYLAYKGLYGNNGNSAPAYGSDNGVGVYSPNQYNPIDAAAR